MKQMNKLSEERISAEFSVTAEKLGKRVSLRKKLETCHDDIGIQL